MIPTSRYSLVEHLHGFECGLVHEWHGLGCERGASLGGRPSWQIVGTGDFDNDSHIDILWRNSSNGSNVVWFMDGPNWTRSADRWRVRSKLAYRRDWRLNRDGNVDLLWRYTRWGHNVVWYLDDATWIGSAELIPVAWQIVGTGDYNNDGNVDILWRYNATGGYNYIWYMDQVTWIGGGDLLPVADLTWKIVNR